jgi:hypothetical protein
MSKHKDRRSGLDRRIAIMSIPHEDRRKIEDDIDYAVHHMAGAKEYFEGVLAKLQEDSYFTLVKTEDV